MKKFIPFPQCCKNGVTRPLLVFNLLNRAQRVRVMEISSASKKDGTRRDSTESPSRHWHYLHHLHGSLWHG